MGDPSGFVNGFGIRGLTIFRDLTIFRVYGAFHSGFWEEKYGLEKTGYQELFGRKTAEKLPLKQSPRLK